MISMLHFLDPAYDNMVGRRIQEMKQKALAEAARPLVDDFFKTSLEFLEDEGIENFKYYVCAGATGSQIDYYHLATQLEDLGPEWCANYVGFKIKRESATDLILTFAKCTNLPKGNLTNDNKD